MCADFERWFLNVFGESVWRRRADEVCRYISHFSTTSPKNGKVHSVVLVFGVGLFSGVMVECPVVLLWCYVFLVGGGATICFGDLFTIWMGAMYRIGFGFKWINLNVMNQVRIFTSMSAHRVDRCWLDRSKNECWSSTAQKSIREINISTSAVAH